MNGRTFLARCLLVFSLAGLCQRLSAAEQYNAVYGHGANALTIATGSPGELGLLAALAEAFNRRHDTTIRWRRAGSGMALTLLKEKKANVVMVHAPEAEKQAVAEGWAVDRTLLGCNEFYLVGPADDPARVSEAATVGEAYRRIAGLEATFLSRGDNSGTHKKEMAIWRQAGIAPAGDWYVVTRDFMLTTLKRANDQNAYFMTDSSTWVAAQADLQNVSVLFRGDPALVNVYHALRQPQGATKGESYGSKFVGYLRSEEAQAIIRGFGKARYGEPMYHDAEYAKAVARRLGPKGTSR